MTPNLNDEDLRRLLRAHWPAEVRATPEFRAGVWARIEAERRGPASWAGWLRLHLAGTAWAAAASIALAVAAGGWLATAEAEAARSREAERYVATIDPHARVGFASDDTGRAWR